MEVTGVFRAQARRVNPKITKVKSVYKTYVDAIHFRKVVNQRSGSSGDAPSSSNFVNNKDSEGVGNDAGKENQQPQVGRGAKGDEVTHGSRYSPERIAELEALAHTPDM